MKRRYNFTSFRRQNPSFFAAFTASSNFEDIYGGQTQRFGTFIRLYRTLKWPYFYRELQEDYFYWINNVYLFHEKNRRNFELFTDKGGYGFPNRNRTESDIQTIISYHILDYVRHFPDGHE